MIPKERLVKLLDDRFDLIIHNDEKECVAEVAAEVADEIIALIVDTIKNLEFKV